MTKFTRALEKCEALCYNSYRKKHLSKIEFLNKKEYLQLWMYTYKKLPVSNIIIYFQDKCLVGRLLSCHV